LPALSVAGHVTMSGDGPHGGPRVPCTIVKVAENEPSAFDDAMCENDGAVQPSETACPTGCARLTLVWVTPLGASSHSSRVPGELGVRPVAVIVTD